MKQQEYALKYRDRYMEWAFNIQQSSYTPMDKTEFAIISAHTRQEYAVEGFLTSREREKVTDIANALADASVIAPFVKASFIIKARESKLVPFFSYDEFRHRYKIKGLGYCKLSFACCLIDPFESDVVCLDTHMIQVLTNSPPSAKMAAKVWSNLENYRRLENIVKIEARNIGCPLFVYQWMLWDWKRQLPDNHSFLWQGGRTDYQERMLW